MVVGENGAKNEHVKTQRPGNLQEDILGGWKKVIVVVVEKVNDETKGKMSGNEQIGGEDSVDENSECDQEWKDVPVIFK